MSYTPTLDANNITIYTNNLGIFLVEKTTIIMAFAKRISKSSNSIRTSVWEEKNWKPYSIGVLPPDVTIVKDSSQLGSDVCDFLNTWYENSQYFRSKGNPYAERVLYIKSKNTLLSDDVARLIAKAGNIDEETLHNVIFDIRRSAPISVMLNKTYADKLRSGNKREKKEVMREVLEPQTYELLNLDTRGRHYTDAMAAALLRCC